MKRSPPYERQRIGTRSHRTRLEMIALEDRTVPTTVTISAISDAYAGGADGIIRITRDNTVGALDVDFSLSGTAVDGTDYSVVADAPIASGQSYYDVSINAFDASTDSEPTKTVTMTVTAGHGMSVYTVGSPASATINLYDDDADVVTVAAGNDAAEGGTDGQIILSRTGDLSTTPTVNFTVGGTATSGTDFTSLGTSVTFAANSSTASVNVTAADDNIYDPDETVEVTLGTGTGYTPGSPDDATITIADDTDAVQTLIDSESFQLTGANGNVDVTLAVTYNATGAAGLYTWVYSVSNPSVNTTSWTDFSIPVDNTDGLDDVANLASSIGWTGSINSDSVSWTKGSGSALAPGNTATFSFTTDPRDVGDADVEMSASGGTLSAGIDTAPAPKTKASVPQVNVNFQNGSNIFKLNLSMTPVDGSTGLATGDMSISASTGSTARDFVLTFLRNNGWSVEPAGDTGLIILGKLGTDGKPIAPGSLNWFIIPPLGA